MYVIRYIMFKIYVKPGCPYCQETINTVTIRNISHKIISLKTEKRREEIKNKHNYSTFPQVFFKSAFIGGNSEFQAIINKCDQMNNMFDSMEPKTLKLVMGICCSLSTKKTACMFNFNNSNSTKKVKTIKIKKTKKTKKN